MAGEYDFKRTSAQIETLLDKIPSEGDIAKVYNTTLDLFSIEDGSVVTKDQRTEVSNIMDKWNQGYIVTYVDTRQNSFHYGVLNVCRCDDGIPTTLSVINDRGDLLAYSFEPGGEETWTVTNKTSGGAVYQTTLDFKSIDDGSEITGEQAFEINNIISKFRSGYNIVYTIDNQDGLDLIPRGNVLISIREDDYVIVFTIISAEEPRTIYYQVEGGGSEGGNWTVTNKTNFIRYKRDLGPTANASTKSINFYMPSVTNECWYILVLNFDAFINGSTYQCRASVPIYVPDTAGSIFYSQAFMDCSGGPILVEISVGASGVNVKLKTSYTITSFTATYGNSYLIKIQA